MKVDLTPRTCYVTGSLKDALEYIQVSASSKKYRLMHDSTTGAFTVVEKVGFLKYLWALITRQTLAYEDDFSVNSLKFEIRLFQLSPTNSEDRMRSSKSLETLKGTMPQIFEPSTSVEMSLYYGL